MNQKEIGLYIHIPFCKQKCNYCDFCSYANKDELIATYIKWLKQEIEDVGKTNKKDAIEGRDNSFLVKTIYIGGGTPSYIDSKYIVEIMDVINKDYEISKEAEITIEINPGTVTAEKLQDYYNSGINRISIGLQSSYDSLLNQLGRIHTYQEFLNTYNLARQIGFKNINVDLMLGLPNQTLKQIENSVKDVVKLSPEHISVYSLIIEEGTKLEKQIESGELKLPDEKIERKMYWKIKKLLEDNGYIHYEISNFAKKGYESKHNCDCWEQKEYIGFGSSSHSYTNGIRYSNVDLEEYIQNFEKGKLEDNLIFHEKQNLEDMQKEYMLLGLRKIDGVSIQSFKNKFVENPIYLYHEILERLVKQKLIEIDGDKIRLTDKGVDFANVVWEEFV